MEVISAHGILKTTRIPVALGLVVVRARGGRARRGWAGLVLVHEQTSEDEPCHRLPHLGRIPFTVVWAGADSA